MNWSSGAPEIENSWFMGRRTKMVFGFGFWSPIKLVTSSKSLIGLNMLKIADHKPRTFQNAIKNVIELVDQGVLKPTVGKEFDHTKAI